MDSDDDNKMITIKNLQADSGVTDDQLDQKCPLKHLKKVAPHVGNYLKFAARFNLPPAKISDIKIDGLLDFGQKTEAVFEWWSSNVRNATYRSFIQTCIDLSEGDIARRMSKLCAQGLGTGSVSLKENGATSSPKSDDPPPSKHPRPDTELPADNAQEDDEHNEELQQFCTAGEDILEQEDIGPLNVPGALPGSARRHLLWDVKQIPELKVHFLNPKLLEKEKWKCGRSQLTINSVLDWAADVWNSHADQYPRISDDFATKEEAQIRVFFTSNRKYTSWSKVGTAADLETDATKPTMVLNLKGMTKAEQRSMVIHEFGHALGLDHEHQRSDLWDVLEQKDEDGFRFIIGKARMKKGSGCLPACAAVFRAEMKAPQGAEKTDYDSQSIMHYWFDKNWLQPEYRDLKAIKRDQTLSDRERKVLEGVHARDYRKGGNLAKNPSKLDYETLNKAYGAPVAVLQKEDEDRANGPRIQPTNDTATELDPSPVFTPQAPSSSQTTPSLAAGTATYTQLNPPPVTTPPTTSQATPPLAAGDILKPSHASALLEVLNDARATWYFIGEGIGCKISDLDAIEENHLHNKAMCLRKMLQQRLAVGGLTRSKLCASLRGYNVGRNDVAEEVERLNLNNL